MGDDPIPINNPTCAVLFEMEGWLECNSLIGRHFGIASANENYVVVYEVRAYSSKLVDPATITVEINPSINGLISTEDTCL